MEDVEVIKRNSAEYARTSKKSVDVLKNANGKRHYTEIAQMLGMHPTKVSGLLKKAEKLGLAKNVKLGIYKRNLIMSYMPKNNGAPQQLRTTSDLIKKISKKRRPARQTLVGFNIPSTIFSNIDQMTVAYSRLYAVENSLRALIRKVFSKQTDWWKHRIPPGVHADVAETINRTPYHAAQRKDELEFTHLGQLKEIIIWSKNWNDFVPYIKEKDKNTFAITINRAIASRNAVGHCTALEAKDLKIVDVRFEDILKML